VTQRSLVEESPDLLRPGDGTMATGAGASGSFPVLDALPAHEGADAIRRAEDLLGGNTRSAERALSPAKTKHAHLLTNGGVFERPERVPEGDNATTRRPMMQRR
jgi:hypothetical protein